MYGSVAHFSVCAFYFENSVRASILTVERHSASLRQGYKMCTKIVVAVGLYRRASFKCYCRNQSN